MTGLVAAASMLGGVVPAVAASVATRGTAATSVPAVAVRLATAARPGEPTWADLASAGSRISCGSPTDCLAVGTNVDGGANLIPVAESLHGGAWKPLVVKVPKVTATALTGVSCKAATYCLVVGTYSGKGGNAHPVAWTWNGTALTPLAALPLPAADRLSDLSAVSCVAVKSCLVIGTAFPAGAGTVQLVWTWNGSKWAVKTAAMPANAADVGLTAARCFSLTSCVVAGITWLATPTAFTENPFLATWNGNTITSQTAAAPAGITQPFVTGLSCSSPRSCAAVGTNLGVNSASMFGFAEVWNGKSWTATKWTGPKGITHAGLISVSCASATSCVAVGFEGTETTMTAASLSFNGSKWSVVKAPSVGNGLFSDFEGVSCPKTGDCVSIGQYGKITATTSRPLAGYSNGLGWTLKPA